LNESIERAVQTSEAVATEKLVGKECAEIPAETEVKIEASQASSAEIELIVQEPVPAEASVQTSVDLEAQEAAFADSLLNLSDSEDEDTKEEKSQTSENATVAVETTQTDATVSEIKTEEQVNAFADSLLNLDSDEDESAENNENSAVDSPQINSMLILINLIS
jgi:hypothetical protein